MAEAIIESVKGQENLKGTTHFWEMIVKLRPFLFQVCVLLCPFLI